MKLNEFLNEEQLDEILPALGAIAGRAIVGAAAKGAARGVAKTVGGIAGRVTGAAASNAMSNKLKTSSAPSMPANSQTTKAVDQAKAQADQQIKQQLLKKGNKLPLPTKGPSPKPQDFEIDDVRGNEVTLKNPNPQPGEPLKTIHKKQDLDPAIQQIIQR